jgi:nucleoside phosphorylase
VPIYLSYLDRELGRSVGFVLSKETLWDATSCLLLAAYEPLYCGLSLLWEQPATKGSWKALQLLLATGHLHAVTAYPSGAEFLSAKRVAYAHDTKRYARYFRADAESKIGGFTYFEQVSGRTTDVLVGQLSEWSSAAAGPIGDLPKADQQRVQSSVMNAFESRGARAVTYTLFEPGLREIGASAAAVGTVGRMISLAYTDHYRRLMLGVCPTGIPGLAFYDPSAGSFPYLDIPILQRLLSLFEIPRLRPDDLPAFLEAKGRPEHALFVSSLRRLLAGLSVGTEHLASARAAIMEGISSHSRSLASFRGRRRAPSSWRETFNRATDLAGRLLGAGAGVDSIEILGGSMHDLRTLPKGDLLLVTATTVEQDAVLSALKGDGTPVPPTFVGASTYYAGTFAGHRAVLVRCEPGSVGRDASILVVEEAIRVVRPRAVVMVGIAFGADEAKQKIGDVLVSRQIRVYEPQKVATTADGERNVIPRGPSPLAGAVLFNRFRDCSRGWSRGDAAVRIGLVLSGEKLVNNRAFKKELLLLEPEAIGGEMEGAGLYAAAERKRIEWIIVKAIADWGDGNKKDDWHKLAAENAVSLVEHVLQHDDVLSACVPFRGDGTVG